MATLRAMPILLVKDVEASAAFYGRLGFDCHGFFGDPPGFGVIQRGDVSLGLNRLDAPGPWPKEAWAAYIYVSDANALHREMSGADLPFISDLRDQPFGCRDFEIEDIDGYRIAFGQDMITQNGAPGLADTKGRG